MIYQRFFANYRLIFLLTMFGCIYASGLSVRADTKDEERQRKLRAELSQLDKNGNGALEPDEWKQPLSAMLAVSKLAKTAGLDVQQPLSIEKLVAGVAAGSTTPENSASPPASASKPAATATSPAGQPADFATPSGSASSTKSTSTGKQAVSGFNSPPDKVAGVSGFGSAPSAGPGKSGSAAPLSGGSSPRTPIATTTSSSANPDEFLIRRSLVEKIIKDNDSDGDGMLKESVGEWDKLKSIYKGSDANKDRVLTKEELIVGLAPPPPGEIKETPSVEKSAEKPSSSTSSSTASRSNDKDKDRRFSDRDKSSFRSGSGSSSSKDKDKVAIGPAKSYRQTSPTERLPKGLPDWFLRNDADEDGQIMMAEFSVTWNEAKAAEFKSYDLDGDGFITAKECLKKLEKK